MLLRSIRYATQSIELEYRLQPFIPDFIPAVGDIDAFIKVSLVNFLINFQLSFDL